MNLEGFELIFVTGLLGFVRVRRVSSVIESGSRDTQSGDFSMLYVGQVSHFTFQGLLVSLTLMTHIF